MVFKQPSQTQLSDPAGSRQKGEHSDPEIDLFIFDGSISSLPYDVADALLAITSGLEDITLHPVDPFTHDLLFHVNIKDELYVSLKCAYTDRNFKELLAFSKDIIASQPALNVFNPTGWKEGQKRICLIIKHWVAPLPLSSELDGQVI